jgi:hypothetical protein
VGNSAVLGPLVLTADLLLLFGSKVVGDVECLANLVGGLALDHVGHRLAADVEERLDVEIVGSLENSVSVVAVRRMNGEYVPE